MNSYSSLSPRTQAVLSLFLFKIPILGRRLANTVIIVSAFFYFNRTVCLCVIAMTTATIHGDELSPLQSLNNCELYYSVLFIYYC